MSFDSSSLESKRTDLENFGLVAVLDTRTFTPDRLADRLTRLWKLDSPFWVEGQVGNYFLFKFSYPLDLDFVIENGPWSVDNSLLVVDRLLPNMALHSMRVVAIPVWVQLWGLPLDYHIPNVARDLGNVIGMTMHSDVGEVLYSSQLNFLQVKVQIEPRLPLVQNIRIRLDNEIVCTVECKFERVFRSCSSCHQIGHQVSVCPLSNAQKVEGFDKIAIRTFNKFGTRFLCNFNARSAELVWQDWIHTHRTRGSTRIRFNKHNLRYFVFEALPQDVLLHYDRFEGILHFTDDESLDDDSPPAPDSTDAPPSATNSEPMNMDEETEDGLPSDHRGEAGTDAVEGDPDYLAYLQTLVPLDSQENQIFSAGLEVSTPANDVHHPIIILDDPGTDLSLQLFNGSDITVQTQPLDPSLLSLSNDHTLAVITPSNLVSGNNDESGFNPLLSSINVNCPALELAFNNFISSCIFIHANSSESQGVPTPFCPPLPIANARASEWFLTPVSFRPPTALLKWLHNLQNHLTNQIDSCGLYFKVTSSDEYIWRIFLDSDPKFGTLFHRHPPFYFSEAHGGTLAYTTDMVDTHKSGFICIDLKNHSLVSLPPPARPLITPDPASGSSGKKRSAEDPLDDPPAFKKGHFSDEVPSMSLAKEAATNLLPKQP